jgi:hypothetical protein
MGVVTLQLVDAAGRPRRELRCDTAALAAASGRLRALLRGGGSGGGEGGGAAPGTDQRVAVECDPEVRGRCLGGAQERSRLLQAACWGLRGAGQPEPLAGVQPK